MPWTINITTGMRAEAAVAAIETEAAVTRIIGSTAAETKADIIKTMAITRLITIRKTATIGTEVITKTIMRAEATAGIVATIMTEIAGPAETTVIGPAETTATETVKTAVEAAPMAGTEMAPTVGTEAAPMAGTETAGETVTVVMEARAQKEANAA